MIQVPSSNSGASNTASGNRMRSRTTVTAKSSFVAQFLESTSGLFDKVCCSSQMDTPLCAVQDDTIQYTMSPRTLPYQSTHRFSREDDNSVLFEAPDETMQWLMDKTQDVPTRNTTQEVAFINRFDLEDPPGARNDGETRCDDDNHDATTPPRHSLDHTHPALQLADPLKSCCSVATASTVLTDNTRTSFEDSPVPSPSSTPKRRSPSHRSHSTGTMPRDEDFSAAAHEQSLLSTTSTQVHSNAHRTKRSDVDQRAQNVVIAPTWSQDSTAPRRVRSELLGRRGHPSSN